MVLWFLVAMKPDSICNMNETANDIEDGKLTNQFVFSFGRSKNLRVARILFVVLRTSMLHLILHNYYWFLSITIANKQFLTPMHTEWFSRFFSIMRLRLRDATNEPADQRTSVNFGCRRWRARTIVMQSH